MALTCAGRSGACPRVTGWWSFLFFYLDLPLEEVAQVAGISVSAARGRLERSVKQLRPGLELEEALR